RRNKKSASTKEKWPSNIEMKGKLRNTLMAQQCETGPNILYHRVNLKPQ
ncbi:4510_t:CDS:1, partial [Gigaspora rosea]